MRNLLGPVLALVMMYGAGTAYAQNYNNLKPAVKAAAKKMNDALVKKDLKTFMATTHPKVIATTEGGADKLITDLSKQIESMESQGSKILSAWPGEASAIIDTAGELQCTIPQYMKMKLSNGVLTTQTTLISVSMDRGKTWYFVDATDKTLANWRTVFPNLSTQLTWRPAPEPKFTPKK
ncbi:MAG TPA: hypothetical protein VGD89_10815 [Flavipsychrobacter sp.]